MENRNRLKRAGSLTAEAAFIIPLSFYTIYAFLYLFLMQLTELRVYGAMEHVADKVSSYGVTTAYLENSRILLSKIDFISDEQYDFLKDIIIYLGDEIVSGKISEELVRKEFSESGIDLPNVEDGIDGLDFTGTEIYRNNNNIHIRVTYTFIMPVTLFSIGDKEIRQDLYTKGFYGTEWGMVTEFDDEDEIFDGSGGEEESKRYVYVTENGEVYHTNPNCSYISYKINEVSYSEIGDYRNFSGAKYYACSSCADSHLGDTVYITDYGTRFHLTRGCSQIERNAKKIDYFEATERGLRECSKCAKERND